MSTGKSLGQNDISRFLLGLGIGLLVGIIFKPPSDYSRSSERVPQPPEVDRMMGQQHQSALSLPQPRLQ
jgi:hypothetical protein